jgi:hypothetical protein
MAAWIYPEDGSNRIITFDVIEAETHETVSEITSHPVESGVEITDHVRPLPDRLSLVGYVTNQPIYVNPFTQRGELINFPLQIPEYFPSPEALLTSPGGALRFGAGALGDAIGDLLGFEPPSAQLLAFSEPFNAIVETYETLLELQKSGILSQIVTPIRFYDDMIIERVSAPRIVGDSGVSFQIDVRQLRVVESGQVAAPPVPVEPRGVPEQVKGGQGAKPPDPGEDSEAPRSLALSLLDSAGLSGALE